MHGVIHTCVFSAGYISNCGRSCDWLYRAKDAQRVPGDLSRFQERLLLDDRTVQRMSWGTQDMVPGNKGGNAACLEWCHCGQDEGSRTRPGWEGFQLCPEIGRVWLVRGLIIHLSGFQNVCHIVEPRSGVDWEFGGILIS